jgi:hypothetical protein
MFGQLYEYRDTLTFNRGTGNTNGFDGFFEARGPRIESYLPFAEQYSQTFTPAQGFVLIVDPGAGTTVVDNSVEQNFAPFAVIAAVAEDEEDFSTEEGTSTTFRPGDLVLLAQNQIFGYTGQPCLGVYETVYLNAPFNLGPGDRIFDHDVPLGEHLVNFCIVPVSDLAAKITIGSDRGFTAPLNERTRFVNREPSIFGPIVF